MTFAKKVYSQASGNRNCSGGDVQAGGGPLVISMKSVQNLSVRLLPHVMNFCGGSIQILWVSE